MILPLPFHSGRVRPHGSDWGGEGVLVSGRGDPREDSGCAPLGTEDWGLWAYEAEIVVSLGWRHKLGGARVEACFGSAGVVLLGTGEGARRRVVLLRSRLAGTGAEFLAQGMVLLRVRGLQRPEQHRDDAVVEPPSHDVALRPADVPVGP